MIYLIAAIAVLGFIAWFLFGTGDTEGDETSIFSVWMEIRATKKRCKIQEQKLAQMRAENSKKG